MSYTTVHIQCSEDQAELLGTLFLDAGYIGTSFESETLTAYAQGVQELPASIHAALETMNLQVSAIDETAEENWNELWESNFHDLMVKDIHVRAPFHPSIDSKYEIVIHPKMAFGTGHHGTTQLMLEAMLNQDFTGKEVLDMGCGSGILAILASQRGADAVLAIDYDINSIRNCEENLQLNGIENVSILQADNLDKVTTTFDIILSNIVKNINLGLFPSYSQKLNKGGLLIVCGLLRSDLEEAVLCAEALHLKLTDQSSDGEWLQLNFIKTNG